MSERVLPLPAPAAFELVTDFSRHGEWIPLTRMTVPPRRVRAGDRIVARTARVIPDRMSIERLEPPSPPAGAQPSAPAGAQPLPPASAQSDGVQAVAGDGVAVLRKHGPLLLGSAQITVSHVDAGRARVRWEEDVWLRGPLPRHVTRALLAPALDGMVALALWRMERALRRRS